MSVFFKDYPSNASVFFQFIIFIFLIVHSLFNLAEFGFQSVRGGFNPFKVIDLIAYLQFLQFSIISFEYLAFLT